MIKQKIAVIRGTREAVIRFYENFEKLLKKNDKIKADLCIEKGIKLIYIDDVDPLMDKRVVG